MLDPVNTKMSLSRGGELRFFFLLFFLLLRMLAVLQLSFFLGKLGRCVFGLASEKLRLSNGLFFGNVVENFINVS